MAQQQSGGSTPQMQSILVFSEIDDRKFKMVMKGDLRLLSVEKIKRYLEKSTGIPPGEQTLMYNGLVLSEDMVGEDFNLQPNATLRLSKVGGIAKPSQRYEQPTQPTALTGSGGGDYSAQRGFGGGGPQGYGGGQSPQHHYNNSQQPIGPNADGSLAEDAEGRRRMRAEQQYANRNVNLATGSKPTDLAGAGAGGMGDLFDRAARQQRMTSPRTGTEAPHHQSPSMRGGAATGGQQQYDSYHYTGDASNGAGSSPGGGINTSAQYAPHPLQTKVQNLTDENRALREEIEAMQRQQQIAKQLKPTSQQQLLSHAKAMLGELGKELGMHLAFDANFTCVVGSDEKNTMVVTCDVPTERIYLYSTLATNIPIGASERLRLYETLLEGAMLGRDMAGGGCGISLDSGLIMMSTSVDLKHTDVTALRDTAPVFVESLVRWRNVVSEIVGPSADTNSVPRRAAPGPPTY